MQRRCGAFNSDAFTQSERMRICIYASHALCPSLRWRSICRRSQDMSICMVETCNRTKCKEGTLFFDETEGTTLINLSTIASASWVSPDRGVLRGVPGRWHGRHTTSDADRSLEIKGSFRLTRAVTGWRSSHIICLALDNG